MTISMKTSVEHMATEEWPAEQVRAHMESVVPGLKHWK